LLSLLLCYFFFFVFFFLILLSRRNLYSLLLSGNNTDRVETSTQCAESLDCRFGNLTKDNKITAFRNYATRGSEAGNGQCTLLLRAAQLALDQLPRGNGHTVLDADTVGGFYTVSGKKVSLYFLP